MDATLGSQLGVLDARISEHVSAIVGTARSAPPGGGHGWDRLLAFYGVGPEGVRARVDEVRRLGLQAGAIPGEVRRALASMVARAEAELRRLAALAPADPRVATITVRLSRLVEEEGARYERSARCQRVASVFANAAVTSKQVPWAGQVIDAAIALACPACGAPQERPLDFQCRYCHAPMARSAEET
jgi:hypothetical protein